MMDNEWGMAGWGMGLMWVLWPLLILGVVILVVFLVRQSTGTPGPGGGSAAPRGEGGRSRAREILDERYARGEIDDQEYHQRLRHLRGDVDE